MRLQVVQDIIYLVLPVQLHVVCCVQAWTRRQAEHKDPSADRPFLFRLQRSCDDWVIFSWDAVHGQSLSQPYFSSCEITYMDQQSQALAKLVMVIMHPESRTIRLSNLKLSTSYAASLTCNETLTSNTVYFVTGYPCTQMEIEKHKEKMRQRIGTNDTEVSKQPVTVTAASSEYSMTDMVLGVFLALCGVIITVSFAYYYWKKRRHRQRIQRIFGQSHLEPFLALHTPTDQPTTSF